MCKYCDAARSNGESTLTFTGNEFGEYPVSSGVVKPKEDDRLYHVKAGNYYFETIGDDAVYKEINYCPICGRSLNVEDC